MGENVNEDRLTFEFDMTLEVSYSPEEVAELRKQKGNIDIENKALETMQDTVRGIERELDDVSVSDRQWDCIEWPEDVE